MRAKDKPDFLQEPEIPASISMPNGNTKPLEEYTDLITIKVHHPRLAGNVMAQAWLKSQEIVVAQALRESIAEIKKV